jgi:hypothetical protein
MGNTSSTPEETPEGGSQGSQPTSSSIIPDFVIDIGTQYTKAVAVGSNVKKAFDKWPNAQGKRQWLLPRSAIWRIPRLDRGVLLI